MQRPRRILVADVPVGISAMRRILAPHATVLGASLLDEAIAAIGLGVDLIACGMHFDESRMFDLLRRARAHAAAADVPFVCLCELDGRLGRSLLEGLEIACDALGARFVDLHDLRTRYGNDAADDQFRRLVLSLLPSGDPV